MKNDLTVKEKTLPVILEEKGIGEVIKPLVQEVHLFDTFIAGTSHLKDNTALLALHPGDRLKLKREENIYDDNAVAIYSESGGKLGYVPEKDNIVFSRLMDAGKLLAAKVTKLEDLKYFVRVSVSIYLVDY